MPKSIINHPEIVRRYYDTINESIVFHKCLIDRSADAVCWENVVFKKERGVKILEAMLSLEKSDNKQKEIRADLEYWKTYYDSIRERVYQV